MLHDRLVELRNIRSLRQYEVADAIGIVRVTYSTYERGFRIPDAYTLSRIADFYQVTTDYLLGREEHSKFIPQELLQIASEVSQGKQHEFWNEIIKYAKFIQTKD